MVDITRCRAARKSSAAFAEPLEPRRLLAAVSWDGGGNGLSWHDPLNWSTDVLPGPSDDVTISVTADPTVRIESGTHQINSLTSSEAIEIAGGTLGLAAESRIDADFTHTSGWLSGDGDLFVGGATLLDSGAYYAGGGTLNLGGPARVEVNEHMNGPQLNDTRRLVLTSNTIMSADPAVSPLSSSASVRVSSGAAIVVEAGVELRLEGGVDLRGSSTGSLINAGTIVGHGPGESIIGINYSGEGSVTAAGGTLTLSGGSTASDLRVEAGARSIAGAGTVRFFGGGTSSATVHIYGTYNITGETHFTGSKIYFHPQATLVSLGNSVSLGGGFVYLDSGEDIVTSSFNSPGGWLLGSDDLTVNGPAFIGGYTRLGGSGE